MYMIFSLVIVTVGLGIAILIGISRGVNKSKNEIYFQEKVKELKSQKEGSE